MTYHLRENPTWLTGLLNHEADEVDILDNGVWPSPSKCPICWGSGTFRWYAYEAIDAAGVPPMEVVEFECPCVEQWMLHRFFSYCGLSLLYQRLSIRDFSSSEVQDLAIKYIAQVGEYIRYGQGMFLVGSHGTGKSMIAALVTKAAIYYRFSAYFITFNDLVNVYIQTKFSPEKREEMKRRFLGVNLLVIDDVGQEETQNVQQRKTSQARAILDEVLRGRQGLCTFVTSNFPKNTLAEHYGQNVVSLLSELDKKELYSTDFRGDFLPKRTQLERSNHLTRPVVWGAGL